MVVIQYKLFKMFNVLMFMIMPTVSSVGGVLPHTYSWDIGQIGNFMPDTTNLCYGGHDIIIEDQVGCRKTVYYQISQPDELFAISQWVDMIDCLDMIMELHMEPQLEEHYHILLFGIV